MILEPYKVEIIDTEKVDYSWFNNTCCIGKDWMQFFPDNKKNFRTGTYLFCKGGYFIKIKAGDFARVGKMLFLGEHKENFYA